MPAADGRRAADGRERAAAAAGESVEHVDETGTVLGVVSRAEMRARNLRHRCTYIAVIAGAAPAELGAGDPPRFDPEIEIWVHKRAEWKDTNPSFWDLAFGGVCDVGEDWLGSAERELAEEAGIDSTALFDLGSCRYENEVTKVVGRSFVAWWPDEPSCPDGEVVAIDRVSLKNLRTWVGTNPVCADSAAIMVPLLTG